MINKEIAKITGQPCCVGKGNSNNSTSNVKKGDLGMGKFNPKAGANKDGKYIVDGCDAYGSGK
jgi:hypothetical protein